MIVGLDLGQAQDFSALVALDRKRGESPQGRPWWEYACPMLHRWKLGTSYPQIVEDFAGMVEDVPGEGQSKLKNCTLVVDGTGVGRAVVDLFRVRKLPVKLIAVSITFGSNVTSSKGFINVPKKELASTLVSVFQSRRLKIAKLPDRETLVHELSHFKVKVTSAGNETFEAWRERDHDDLVLALAIAVWFGERAAVTTSNPVQVGGPRDMLGQEEEAMRLAHRDVERTRISAERRPRR